MAEEETIKDTFIKFISPVPDLDDKRNEKAWNPGYITIDNQKITLKLEENNQPTDEGATSIVFSDVTDVDRRINLWKKIIGTAKILPIHHMIDGEETVSLISTSVENADKFKKMLIILLTTGSDIEFVCPFSKGGKILLEKQPTKGKMELKDNTVKAFEREKKIIKFQFRLYSQFLRQ